MKRREFIISAAAAMAAPNLASAGDIVDAFVAMLREQGYTKIKISRTWLGRTRIVAISSTLRRETILNPASGEILRDFWEVIGENGESASGLFRPEDDDGEDANQDDDDDGDDDDDDGDDDGDDDDDDDDDEDDDDDDDDDS